MPVPAKVPAKRKAKGYDGSLTLPDSMRQSEVTIPGVELYHYITDDQLTELSEMRAEPVMEVTVGAAGIFAGSLTSTIEALSRFQDKVHPMGYVGLVTAMITVVSFFVALLAGTMWFFRHRRHESLAKRIRSRPRVKVTPANDDASGGPQAGRLRPIH